MARPNAVIRDLEKWKLKETDSFSKRLTKASKLASVSLQRRINSNVKGPVNFTKNSVGFNFKVTRDGSQNRIYIKDAQAGYLSHLIDNESPIDKFVPTGVAGSKNQFGNIPNLKTKRNLESVEQKVNGSKRTILIKKTAKQNKRVIAIFKRNQKRRKVIGSWNSISNNIVKQVKRVAKLS